MTLPTISQVFIAELYAAWVGEPSPTKRLLAALLEAHGLDLLLGVTDWLRGIELTPEDLAAENIRVSEVPSAPPRDREAEMAQDVALLETRMRNLSHAFAIGMATPRCPCGAPVIGGTMSAIDSELVSDVVVACANPKCKRLTERHTFEEPIDFETAMMIAKLQAPFRDSN